MTTGSTVTMTDPTHPEIPDSPQVLEGSYDQYKLLMDVLCDQHALLSERERLIAQIDDRMCSCAARIMDEAVCVDCYHEMMARALKAEAEVERLSHGLYQRSPPDNPAMVSSAVDSALNYIDQQSALIDKLALALDDIEGTTQEDVVQKIARAALASLPQPPASVKR
jgi:hypothetical protein